MVRRRRVDKRRRGVEGLEAGVAFAAAQVYGCAAVPPEVTVDDLFDVFERVGGGRAGSWADLAFRLGHPRPCNAMNPGHDGWDKSDPPGCGGRCLFGEEPDGE